MANRLWTEEEDNLIRRERAKKTKAPIIAEMLNRPVHATRLRALKLDTRVQPRNLWSDTEKEMLTTLIKSDPPLTDQEIASKMNRSAVSVRWGISALNLVNIRPEITRRIAREKSAEKERARAEKRRMQSIIDAAEKQKRKQDDEDRKAARRLQQAIDAEKQKEKDRTAELEKKARALLKPKASETVNPVEAETLARRRREKKAALARDARARQAAQQQKLAQDLLERNRQQADAKTAQPRVSEKVLQTATPAKKVVPAVRPGSVAADPKAMRPPVTPAVTSKATSEREERMNLMRAAAQRQKPKTVIRNQDSAEKRLLSLLGG